MSSLSPLRLLIVDDSRIFRSAVQDALQGRADVKVVGSVWSGEKALEFIRESPPDLVTLDVNMPGQGGLETLRLIQEFNQSRSGIRPIGVLLVSALTSRGALTTIEGLQGGAFDFIRKPDGPDESENQAQLQQALLEKIELYFQRMGFRSPKSSPASLTPVPKPEPKPAGRYSVLAIGSSTGGPEALARVLPEVTRKCRCPIFIVQHLPAGMTGYFAESLANKCSYQVHEAKDDQLVEDNTIYIAPGGKHMVLRKQDGRVLIALNDLPPENGCRPSVDVFFRSVGSIYPQSVVAIVLTGMGTDGAKGLAPLKRNGAYVIAQDEATSVVWGMPGAAVATNLVDEILPVDRIGPAVVKLLAARAKPCN